MNDPNRPNYDPRTGEKLIYDSQGNLKKAPPAPNNGIMLYHPELEPKVVDKTDKMAMELARRGGYVTERPHGQHPHSHDPARLYVQEKSGNDAALAAKGYVQNAAGQWVKPDKPVDRTAAPVAPVPNAELEELRALIKQQGEQLAALQAGKKGAKPEPVTA